MDRLVGRHLALDGIEKADELLVPVALHAAADDFALEDIEDGEQGGGAMAFVVMGHGGAAPLFLTADRAGYDRGLGSGFSRQGCSTTAWAGALT